MPEGSTGQEGSGAGGQEGQGQGGQEGSQTTETQTTWTAENIFDNPEVKKRIGGLNSEAKSHRERAEAAEAELAELRKGQMSETDRITAEGKEKDARIEALAAENRDLRLEGVVTQEATAAKALDPVLVFRALDRTAVEFDSDGKPTNVKALVGDLKKAHPSLFQRIEGSGDGGSRQGGGVRQGGMTGQIREQLAARRGVR